MPAAPAAAGGAGPDDSVQGNELRWETAGAARTARVCRVQIEISYDPFRLGANAKDGAVAADIAGGVFVAAYGGG